MNSTPKLTPMMQQYAQLKSENPDCLLLFRLGDFYELFEEDAKIGAEILGIVLTSRDGTIPMAGVPYHALDQYLGKLIAAGYKVALCEQITVPDGKTLVERAVVRIVTPGTILDETLLNQKENNYLVAVEWERAGIGLATVDLSTGEFRVSEFTGEECAEALKDELSRIQPTEGIVSRKVYEQPELLRVLSPLIHNVRAWDGWIPNTRTATETLQAHWKVATLQGFGIQNESRAVPAAASALLYLRETQKSGLEHVQPPCWYSPQEALALDRSTLHNLELFHTLSQQDKQGSLLSHLDETGTPAGGRLLRQWLRAPLRNVQKIEQRQDRVAELIEQPVLLHKLRAGLALTADTERILSRFATGLGSPRDFIRLRVSLEHTAVLRNLTSQFPNQPFQTLSQRDWEKSEELCALLSTNILDEPAFDAKAGGILRPGVHTELDELRNTILHTQSWILSREKEERQKTGIPTLKIRSNKVFGLYIEVTAAHTHKVPNTYERKQTLVNCERYITPELKEKEVLLLTAEEAGNRLEYEIYLQLVEKTLQSTKVLQRLSAAVAETDCLANFAQLALRERYVRPVIREKGKLSIENGRHPVVEKLVPSGRFVSNNTELDQNSNQIIILTGPNMAGKSVYMRQVALIVLLAHMGCFVPASSAQIPLVDRIFVRSGAADSITTGLSTFMLEMVESANILRHATNKSLVIMDEIGRGTSTYDGISLAWSIAEYLVRTPGKQAMTLFATHYHELQGLASQYPQQMKNMHLEVKQENGDPVFLYRLVDGGASHSFGIAVAKLAGIPEAITKRATSMLRELEEKQAPHTSEPNSQQTDTPSKRHDTISQALNELDISHMTPLDALNTLAQWKEQL